MAFYNALVATVSSGDRADARLPDLAGSRCRWAIVGGIAEPAASHYWAALVHGAMVAGICSLSIGGGALAFILWVRALERARPTRAVASTMAGHTLLRAWLLSTQLVGRAITANLLVGLVAIISEVWSPRRRPTTLFLTES